MHSTREIVDPLCLARDPVVSIVVLAYLHHPYLGTAIDSILAQDCDFPYEIIIGEDCSPDATLEVALTYQATHPDKIRVLTGDFNIGPRRNESRCMASARGRYIALCEGDDAWTDPSKLSRQIRMLERCPDVTLSCHSAQQIDAASGRRMGRVLPAFSSRTLSMQELILGDGGLIPTASIVFRRTLLNNAPQWYSGASVGDYPLVLLAGLRGDVDYLHRCMAIYRRNVPQSWSARRGSRFEDRLAHARSMRDFFENFDLDTKLAYHSQVRKMISKYLSDALVHFAASSEEAKRKTFLEERSSFTNIDRALLAIQLKTGIPLGSLKTLIRRLGNGIRISCTEVRYRLRITA